MFKKLLTLTLVALGIFSLAACKPDEDNADKTKAEEAKVVLQLVDSGLIEGDMTLQDTLINDATVTWESSNTAVIANDGTVTRPSASEGNVDVTLTATITVGSESVTKEFTVTVKAEGNVTVVTTIAALYDSAILDENVEITGIVTSTFSGGYFVSDGTHALGVYNPGSELEINVGDEVRVRGSYAVYNTLYQIGDVTKEEVLSSGNTNPLAGTEVAKTVAEMLALDSSVETIHGAYYEVTGTLEVRGSYGNLYLVDGEDAVLIYYYSNSDSLEALEAQVGKKVTIITQYYTDHGTNGPMLAYDGGAEGIELVVLTDAESVEADAKFLELSVPGATLEHIVFPTVGPNGSTYTNWVSSEPDVLSGTGIWYGNVDESVVVSYTVLVTKGTETATAEFDIVVPAEKTIAEVLEMDSGSYFKITGIVYETSHYGYYIHENGSYIFVFGEDYYYKAGDEIEIVGSLGFYKGLAQVYPVTTDRLSKDNGLVDAVPSTIGAIVSDLIPRGTIATVTGTVSIEGSYDNVVLTDLSGNKITVYYRSNADEIAYKDDSDVEQGLAGEIVTLDVVTYQDGTVLFQGKAEDITTETAFDDAYTLQSAIDGLMIENAMNLTEDVTLPTEDTGAGVTFAWATDDSAVITSAGVITRVADATPTATLTVTATKGTATATKEIMVKLVDLNDTPLSVSEALAMADGETVTLTGIVSAVYYDDVVIQDVVTGVGIFAKDLGYLAVGDEVVVRGTLGTYTDHSNNQRNVNENLAMIGDVVSTENDIVYSDETDPAVIATEFAMMKSYKDVTIVYDMENPSKSGYLLFDGATMALEISTYYVGAVEDYLVADDSVTATFTVFDVYYGHVRLQNVDVVYEDADKVVIDKGELTINGSTYIDLDLPDMGEYGSAITWASGNTAVIANDGTVTRPDNATGDVTVTLTATFTAGTETATETYDVVVYAELGAQTPGVFFSEYVEEGGNKALEIYNATDSDVDLTNWTLELYANANVTPGSTLDLTGTLAAGATLVIANASSDQAILDAADVQSGTINHNGNDSYKLLNDGTVVDVIGGFDGVYYGADMVLVRFEEILEGSDTFAIGQWVQYDEDVFDMLGAHTVVTD